MQDLEIYIRDLEAGAISDWLGGQLDGLELNDGDVSTVVKGSARFGSERVRISLYPAAFGKRFTCLLLEGDELPWDSDLACARSARQVIRTEIRCSPGDWKEGDPVEEEKWWRLDDRGEQKVVWN